VKWLLDNGAEPNYRYATGYTPLLTAAANGHLEILKALLARGADLHAKSNDGKKRSHLCRRTRQQGSGGLLAPARIDTLISHKEFVLQSLAIK